MEVDDNGNEMISVEVAYATPEKQLIIPLTVPLGTTAYDAVKLSAISEEFSEINIEKDEMGIFSKPLDGKGRPTADEYQLCAGDRVEIYRPLIIDPKSARLNRAQVAKSSKPTRTGQKGKKS
jgi:putative ubiquitin-RnfH superfamily antitoxin RatB of RatAB toxin-antitoxin module